MEEIEEIFTALKNYFEIVISMPSISKQLGPKSPFLTYFTLLSNEDRNRLTNRTNLNWFNFGVLRLWYGGKSLYD